MPGTTAFPGALDAFPEIGPNTPENAPGLEHDVVHGNVHAALAAVQAKVGIDGSVDPASLDGLLALLFAQLGAVKFSRSATWSSKVPIVAAEARFVDLYFPYAVTITGVTILTQGGDGACVVDIRKGAYSAFPTVASICGSAKPAVAAGGKVRVTSFGAWSTVNVAAGDILRFVLESSSLFTDVVATIDYTRALAALPP